MTADVDPAVLTATRESLHRVAEHLLAAARGTWRWAGAFCAE